MRYVKLGSDVMMAVGFIRAVETGVSSGMPV